MKINKKLIDATAFNPTKKSHQMDIFQMCDKIKNNKITLPLYQRDVSWTLQKSVDLLNFQLFGKAPVAPISMNEINNGIAVPQVSFIDRELIDNQDIKADHQSVVDGQQRLTTNFKAYTNHPDFRNIVLDISKATFRIVEGAITTNHVPVGILLNESDTLLENYLTENSLITELYPLMLKVRSKIRGYNYTINIAENLTEDEQIEWFEVLNNAGSRVSALQMSFSKLKLHDMDIYTDYTNPFKEKARSYGYEELFNPFTTNVSYPIAALNPAYEVIVKSKNHSANYAPIPSDTKEVLLTKLDTDDLKEIILLTLKSLESSLEFLEKYSLSEFVTRMDYILYLTGFYSYNSSPLTHSEESNLKNWIETVDFVNKSNSERRKIFTELLSLSEQ